MKERSCLMLRSKPMAFLLVLAVMGFGTQQLSRLLNERRLDQELPGLFARARIEALGPPEFKDSRELVQLGEALFFDKILSGNKNISCATCHHPTLSSADAGSFSIGQGGKGLGRQRQQYQASTTLRNAPALFNLGYRDIPNLFWDGRVEFHPEAEKKLRTPARELTSKHPEEIAKLVNKIESTLEAQVMIPVTDFAEMRGKPGDNELADAFSKAEVWDLLIKRLVGTAAQPPGSESEQKYRALFQAAFPEKSDPSQLLYTDAAKALAAYIRDTFQARQTPMDRYLSGERGAMTLAQKRGAKLFLGEARCATCHSGRHLSNFEYASLAIPQFGPGNVMTAWDEGGTYTRGVSLNTTDDFGRYGVTRVPQDRFLFRVPPLRQVGLTGPWMHNGAFTSLRGALEHILNPEHGLANYKPEGIERKEFLKNLAKNKEYDAERLASFDPRARVSPPLSEGDKDDLLDFLEHALTDVEAVSAGHLRVPAAVPSGIDLRD